jgi:glycerol-3-phosphate acyltransferase PlsY
MVIASWLVSRIATAARDQLLYLEWLSVGAAAVLGHMFSVFLKFKGGKGVSASAGVMLGLIPYYTLPGVLGVCVFVIVLKLSRFVSLASMIGASSFPIFFVTIGLIMNWPVFGTQLPLLLFAVFMVVLIVYRHRSNIARLRAGTESRVAHRR